MNKSNPGSGKSVALSSAVFLLGPIFAVLVATVYKLQAVAILGGGPSGVADPQKLSANISAILYITAIGLLLSIIGLVFLCITLFRYRYRDAWFFWFLVSYGFIVLAFFPIGKVFGICILIYCICSRREFFRSEVK